MNFNLNKTLLIFLVLFILPMAIASEDLRQLPPIKQNDCMPLVQYCGNCTYVNITSITYPNGSVRNLNWLTNYNGGDTYVNNSFCDTSQLGTYVYATLGDPDGIRIPQPVAREVTATGFEFNTQTAFIYLIVFVFAILFFILSVWGAISLPFKNKTDAMTGYIFAIEILKYLKIVCWMIAYLTLMVIFYFIYIMTYSFINLDFVGKIFYFAFYGMVILLLPMFIIGIYVIIANWIRDSQVADALQRGFRIR